MNKIPYYNIQNHIVFVGSVLIPPNETRLVDAALVQLPDTVSSQAKADTDPMAELLKGKVADVVASLPDLTLEQLQHLGTLEQMGQQRKGILGAIAERLLASAADSTQMQSVSVGELLQQDETTVLAALPTLPREVLQQMLESEQENARREGIINQLSVILSEQAE